MYVLCMAMKMYRVLIYGDLKGFVFASNKDTAKRKALKEQKYQKMFWHGKTGRVTNLKVEEFN